jgi:hypothetical protein
MKTVFQTLAALCLFVGTANSQTATYTFESVEFIPNSSSPFLNKAPDSGPGSFLASFTSSPNPAAFFVGDLQFTSPFSGGFLMDGTGPAGGNTLRISLNMPVNEVRFDFALFTPGRLDFVSPVGSISAHTPTSSQLGSLSFQSALGFSEFDLLGFGSFNDSQVSIAIDNLVLTVVPEPATVTLLIVGLGLCARRRI